MKTISLLILGIFATACAESAQPAHYSATEASSTRVIITSADTVSGHSQYLTLGSVRAKCMENPAAGHISAADVIADANGLRQAAFRTYGSRVDAIVDADLSYVVDYGHRYLFDQEGHLECQGTAIHFEG